MPVQTTSKQHEVDVVIEVSLKEGFQEGLGYLGWL